MKKILSVILIALCLSSSFNARAQAFDRDTRTITLSLGAADMFHIPLGYYFYNGFYAPFTGELSVEGNFAIHKYVSLGFTVGVGGRAGGYIYYAGPNPRYAGYYPEFNIPVGFIANFHFYQLIADKASNGGRLHADKLDIYAGLNVGSGIALHPTYVDQFGASATAIDALFFIGPQVGVNYFFTDNIGINGELGWGKTLARVGVIFRLNRSGKQSSGVQN